MKTQEGVGGGSRTSLICSSQQRYHSHFTEKKTEVQ